MKADSPLILAIKTNDVNALSTHTKALKEITTKFFIAMGADSSALNALDEEEFASLQKEVVEKIRNQITEEEIGENSKVVDFQHQRRVRNACRKIFKTP